MFGPAAAALTFAACLATPVQGPNVKAPPFTGRVAPEYDVVDGRFALHVGPLRDPVTELSQAGDPNYYFPAILAPPLAGCWTLTLTTGRLKARLTVLVREHPG